MSSESLSEAGVPAVTPPLQSSGRSRLSGSSLFRRVLKNPSGVASGAFIVLVVAAGLLAPLLATHDPNVASAEDVLAMPSAQHWLGADGSGHDVYSRLLFATRTSLAGAGLALGVAAVLGISAGLLAGYYSRWLESVAGWLSSLLQALPGIVVLLAAAAALGPSIWTAMLIFGVLLAPAFYRIVYSSVSAVRTELYIDAARVSGLSDARIIGRHVLGAVRAPVIILAANIAGIAIAIEAGLDFLGLGDPSAPTWGNMLNDAFMHLFQNALLILWPSAAIGLTCIALVLFGNAIRDELTRTNRPRRRARAARAVVAEVAERPIVHTEQAGRPFGTELLSVSGLAIAYDNADGSENRVVKDVSLTVHRGEVHGLIGESGSGKTQTVWSILGLLPAGGRVAAGSIVFDGEELTTATKAAIRGIRGSRIAYVPQEPMSNLDPSFTIGSQLVEPMRAKLGMTKAQARQRALELLARVGIPDPEGTYSSYPHLVSGGMAQRVLIAGAISCDPDLIIADEPTTALDVTIQAEVLDLLRDLQREYGLGMVLVTHNFGVVADICDRVSVMRAGRIVEEGSVAAIFGEARHEYTKGLLAAILHGSDSRGAFVEAEPAGRADAPKAGVRS